MSQRRKLTFRHAPDTLMEAIRGMEQYWTCDDLRQVGYNAPLHEIAQAAAADARRIEDIAQEMEQAAQKLDARAFCLTSN